MEREALLTISAVADLTGLSVGTIYHWASQKRIPYVKLGRAIRFRRSDIEAWIAGNVVEPRVGDASAPIGSGPSRNGSKTGRSAG